MKAKIKLKNTSSENWFHAAYHQPSKNFDIASLSSVYWKWIPFINVFWTYRLQYRKTSLFIRIRLSWENSKPKGRLKNLHSHYLNLTPLTLLATLKFVTFVSIPGYCHNTGMMLSTERQSYQVGSRLLHSST